MVIRHKTPQVPTPAQSRRAAQRKIAKQLSEGTFERSNIGKKVVQVVSTRAELVNQIVQLKRELYGSSPKFNAKRSQRNASINPQTNKPWTVKQLQNIIDKIERSIDSRFDIFEGEDDSDIETALYYH